MLMVITKMVVTAVAALILLGNLLAAWGIHLVFGSAYAGAEPVFRILLLYIGLTLVNSIATNALLAGGFERQYSRILILGSVVLVVAILVLTPLFGTIGTASGAVFGEFSTVVLMASQARKERLFPGSAIFAGPVFAGCVAGLTAWALWPVHTAVAAVAAGVLFIGLLLLFRVFRDEDIAYLKERLV
jgi:O-antigen/teichoic acid export membrane protein